LRRVWNLGSSTGAVVSSTNSVVERSSSSRINRHTGLILCSRRIAIICSSLNRLRFVVRPPTQVGLYSNLEDFQGLRSAGFHQSPLPG
jgi:hypothetical protein